AGFKAIIAMRRRLAAFETNIMTILSGNRVFSSATMSNLLPPPRFNMGASSKIHNLDDLSPTKCALE
ncbi:hypothetical protein HN51_005010, partial [Arachis hypogaea]